MQWKNISVIFTAKRKYNEQKHEILSEKTSAQLKIINGKIILEVILAKGHINGYLVCIILIIPFSTIYLTRTQWLKTSVRKKKNRWGY